MNDNRYSTYPVSSCRLISLQNGKDVPNKEACMLARAIPADAEHILAHVP